MTKFVVFDNQKQEYLKVEGRRMGSTDLLYETSPKAEKALIFEKKYSLDRLEEALDYTPGTLEFREAPQEAIQAFEHRELLKTINGAVGKYAITLGDEKKSDAAEGIIRQMVYSLSFYFDIDLDEFVDMNELYDEIKEHYESNGED